MLESPLKFGILGPLEAQEAGQHLYIGSHKQRVVLALLLCRANRIVSTVALDDAVWGATPPRTAHKNLQVYVSALRKTIGTGGPRLLHTPPGYTLRIEPEQLDVLQFHKFVEAGRRAASAGDAVTAASLLGQAIRVWRGPVLPELASVPAIAAEAKRLWDQYLYAYEDWAETMVDLGHHVQVVEGIDRLARRYPFRERLRRCQLLALYRSGRPTEALAQFEALRQLLARELGLSPSPVLARLYESILAGT